MIPESLLEISAENDSILTEQMDKHLVNYKKILSIFTW